MQEISDLYLTLRSGYEVRLGNFEKMDEKVRWMRAVEPTLIAEGYTGGVITVSTGENASFLPILSEQQGKGDDGQENGEESFWQDIVTTGEPDEGVEPPEEPGETSPEEEGIQTPQEGREASGGE